MASALHTEHTVSQCTQTVRYMKVENGLVRARACVCVCAEGNCRDFIETKLNK